MLDIYVYNQECIFVKALNLLHGYSHICLFVALVLGGFLIEGQLLVALKSNVQLIEMHLWYISFLGVLFVVVLSYDFFSVCVDLVVIGTAHDEHAVQLQQDDQYVLQSKEQHHLIDDRKVNQ